MFTFRAKPQASRRSLFIAALAIAILSAAPPTSPDEFIRQGNQAIERGEFADAILLFQQAVERGTDPGLVAFNTATAYYQLSNFREAENHYRRALDDAAISTERRAKALFNLGDSLIQQAGEKDLRLLRDAIRCYELCLDAEPEAGLRKDAAHNLELAKLLWNKARAKTSNPPSPNADEPPDQRKPPAPKNDPSKQDSASGAEQNGNDLKKEEIDPKAKVDPKGKSDSKDQLKKSDALPANIPNRLPVLADTDVLEERSPEEVRRYLEAAETRLRDERRRMRENAAVPEKLSGKDW